MKLRRAALLLALAPLAFASTAQAALAKHYFPRAGHRCRAAYHQRYVYVRRDGKRVRQRECVLRRITLRTNVDPTFVQDPTNPLRVTYTYSAAAFAGTVNLAQTGNLPAGILNFYSATTPGGPQQLYCSANVGGSVTDATCPITYPNTGTYAVTTQYVPNAGSAVTETDEETIAPFSTTTALNAVPISCEGLTGPFGQPATSTWPQVACYQLSASVTDQNGGAVAATVHISIPNTLSDSWIAPGTQCSVEVYYSGSSSGGYSPDCRTSSSDVSWNNNGPPQQAWSLTGTFAGRTGWTASTSQPVTLTS